MYLKKIEVQGFKSFANKLVFEFDNGITGIVGPNGSGKSNIADAVRWVLGEQSAKQLRGSKMEDVIFAGTENRKPVSFASVSLSIDNSDHKLDIDYDEVTVTRRVFRSGESEYMINGNSCRLKDINELFYDTGVGKEGYSIIGQGQVDKILSGKPEERREIFDEAAGIVKYKRRKAAAQKSLDNESNNLVRINDILSELEKQVGPLAKQSEKAREYLGYKEKLKNYEVNLFLMESESLKKNLDEVTQRIEIVDADIESGRIEFEQIKTAYDEKDAAIKQTNARIEELTELNNRAQIDKNKLINQIEILKEQIKSANQSDEQLASRINALKEEIDERNEEKSALIKQKFDMNEQIDDIRLRRNKADESFAELNNAITSNTNDIENGKAIIMDNLNRKGAIRTDIQRYETMLEQIGIRKAQINSILINYKTDETRFDDTLMQRRKALNEVSSLIENLTSENNKLAAKRNELNTELADDEHRLSKAKETKMRASTRLETLKNIAERYDGYGNSIRKVMECKEREKGVFGVVADIIKTESAYETAIETALGGTIQNIVTDNEGTAKRMIQYLKQNRFGRATFLPLSAISGRNSKKENLGAENGFIGYASELVETDSMYRELAEYLLGRCAVVDTIDNALKIAGKYHHSIKIVTLEGELLSPGGSMSGGAFKNSGNLLGRRREIEELEAVIDKADKAVENLTAGIAKIREEIAGIDAELKDNRAKLQDKLIEKNTAKMQYDQAESKQNEIKSMYQDNAKEIKEIDNQVTDINDNLKVLRSNLEEIENNNTKITAEIEEKSATVEKLKTELADRNISVQNVHIEYSEISQKAAFIEESIKRVLREIERLNNNIEELQDNKVDSVKEVTIRNEEIESINETVKAADDAIKSYTDELEELKMSRESMNESIKSFFDSREECQKRLVDLEKEQFRLTQNREKFESARDARIDYMWNEYEITLNQAASMRDESLDDEAEIKKNVATIKSSIKSLGEVNVNAIEDYKEVSERYEFLKGQHDDLIVARDRLIGVINELDTGMRERFTEKFAEIKIEFDKVFKQLFGGGKGSIELDEDADILEANITIISQPPGKKLQNMMQLSGGEKALTAICLLFAIQNLKPSPFCLLDEIEAALDDSNVDRFAKYLHNLTKNTQFIVITHRRGTMASADRLYGITMQEKGVSTLVSVDLIAGKLDDGNNQIG